MKFTIAIAILTKLASGNFVGGAPCVANKNVIGTYVHPTVGAPDHDYQNGATVTTNKQFLGNNTISELRTKAFDTMTKTSESKDKPSSKNYWEPAALSDDDDEEVPKSKATYAVKVKEGSVPTNITATSGEVKDAFDTNEDPSTTSVSPSVQAMIHKHNAELKAELDDINKEYKKGQEEMKERLNKSIASNDEKFAQLFTFFGIPGKEESEPEQPDEKLNFPAVSPVKQVDDDEEQMTPDGEMMKEDTQDMEAEERIESTKERIERRRKQMQTHERKGTVLPFAPHGVEEFLRKHNLTDKATWNGPGVKFIKLPGELLHSKSTRDHTVSRILRQLMEQPNSGEVLDDIAPSGFILVPLTQRSYLMPLRDLWEQQQRANAHQARNPHLTQDELDRKWDEEYHDEDADDTEGRNQDEYQYDDQNGCNMRNGNQGSNDGMLGGSFLGGMHTSIKVIDSQFALDTYGRKQPKPTAMKELEAKEKATANWLRGTVDTSKDTLDSGVYDLTADDLVDLKVTNHDHKQFIITTHSSIQQRGINPSTGTQHLPITSKLHYIEMPTIEHWDNDAFIDMWSKLQTELPQYNVGLCPFDTVGIGNHHLMTLIPGLGWHHSIKMDAAIFQIIVSAYGNSENPAVKNAIKLIESTSRSGTELLIDIGTNVVTALNLSATLEQPSWAGNLYELADKLSNYFMLTNKRGYILSDKNKALIYCNKVAEATGMDISSLIMTITIMPENTMLADNMDIKTIARQLAKSYHPDDNTPSRAIMKTQANATISCNDVGSTDFWTMPPHSSSTQALMAQGFEWIVKVAARSGRRIPRGKRAPLHKGFPEPFPDRKIPSEQNKGQICEACGRDNHTIVTCFSLGQSAWHKQLMADGRNDENVKAAMEHWEAHWRKKNQARGRGQKRRHVNLVTLVDEVAVEQGMSTDDLTSQLAWDTFYPDENAVMADDCEAADA